MNRITVNVRIRRGRRPLPENWFLQSGLWSVECRINPESQLIALGSEEHETLRLSEVATCNGYTSGWFRLGKTYL